VKFRNADKIYAGATGPVAANLQFTVRHSHSRDVFAKPSTADHNGASLKRRASRWRRRNWRSCCHAGAR
jgi:hypothetical protein